MAYGIIQKCYQRKLGFSGNTGIRARLCLNRLYSAFVLSAWCLLCVSCSKSEDRRFHIGISQCSEDLWRAKANSEFMREASSYNDIEVEIRSVQDDSRQQIRDVEYFISKGVDLLIISPNESSALTSVVNSAYEKGIPVILYDRKVDSELYSAYVGADNRQIGRQMGDYVISHFMPDAGKCNVVVIRGTRGSTADNERYEGWRDAIGSNPQGRRVNVIGEVYGNFLKEEAYRQMKSILVGGAVQEVHAVVAFNDRMAEGAYEAYMESDYRGGFPAILGVDALSGKNAGIEKIIEGVITASFLYPTGGDVVMDVADRILRGRSYDRHNILNTAAIDMTNARIMKFQQEQIEDRQQKIDNLNSTLFKSQHSLMNYRRNFLLLLMMTMLIVVAGILIFVLYRIKSRLNSRLNEQNRKILSQVNELQIQKEQLLGLSRQLEEATNAKLVFFTNISHEFKTPLTLILGPVQKLLSEGNLAPSVQSSLQIVNRNASRLYSLINEILEFRTIENGKMTVHLKTGDFLTFLTELDNLFNDVFSRRGIKFEFSSEGNDFVFPFDAGKCEKIYFNLMSNAVKHVRDGGVIRTSLTRYINDEGQDKLKLEVFNSDSFIPEDKLKDIFLRFYKIGEDSANTGIGLALTYQLVTVLGGEINAISSENGGTSFSVILPIKADAGQDIAAPDCSYTVTQLSNGMPSARDAGADIDDVTLDGRERILVVEDNTDMLNYISDVIGGDYNVIMAENGRIGLEKANIYVPDIILCDIMMPEMDGFELCRMIKANEKTASIPVILLTASELDEYKEKGYECGADAYMQKPFSARVLKVRIRNLLDKKKSISEAAGNEWLLGGNRELSDESAMLLSRIKNYVENHIRDEISVDDMIADAGLSKSNFYRKLKNITDWSPIDIVNLIRLRRASNLVIHGGMNLSQAAFESGFNSLSYFSRTFVKYYHVSPREWIKSRMGK